MTPAGLQALRDRLSAEPDPARARDIETMLSAVYAVPAPTSAAARARVAFGATVALVEDDGTERNVVIVGEDEIDVERGRIGAESPLAIALIGKRVGSRARWRRPAGDKMVRIAGIAFET